MQPSRLIFRAAETVPGAASMGVRAWAELAYRWPQCENWVFSELKSRLRVRLRKRATLQTGQVMYVDPFDFIGAQIARHGCYEPETVVVFRSLLTEDMVFMDIGANVGQYSLMAASTICRRDSIHAFEPDPITFALLRSNIAANNCLQIRANAMALSDRPGRATLYLSDVRHAGANSLRPTVYSDGAETPVPVDTLDRYAASQSIDRLDLLKLDVEGAELLVLSGGTATIAKHHPTMLVELSVHTTKFGYTFADIVSQFERWDYRLFRVGPLPLHRYVPRSPEAESFNVVAVHQSRLMDLARRGVVEI
jgi:FkbM family methyltransferase